MVKNIVLIETNIFFKMNHGVSNENYNNPVDPWSFHDQHLDVGQNGRPLMGPQMLV